MRALDTGLLRKVWWRPIAGIAVAFWLAFLLRRFAPRRHIFTFHPPQKGGDRA